MRKPKPFFDENGWMIRRIPEDAVADCTVGGYDSTPMVEQWIESLGFAIPAELRKMAESFLDQYTDWGDLQTAPIETLTQRIFWLACSDIRDGQGFDGIRH